MVFPRSSHIVRGTRPTRALPAWRTIRAILPPRSAATLRQHLMCATAQPAKQSWRTFRMRVEPPPEVDATTKVGSEYHQSEPAAEKQMGEASVLLQELHGPHALGAPGTIFAAHKSEGPKRDLLRGVLPCRPLRFPRSSGERWARKQAPSPPRLTMSAGGNRGHQLSRDAPCDAAKGNLRVG
jgi:hypothetical protein